MLVSCLLFSIVASQIPVTPNTVVPGIVPLSVPGFVPSSVPNFITPANVFTGAPSIIVPLGSYPETPADIAPFVGTGGPLPNGPTVFSLAGSPAGVPAFPAIPGFQSFTNISGLPETIPGFVPGQQPAFLLNGQPSVPTGPAALVITTCTVCSTFSTQNYAADFLATSLQNVTVVQQTCVAGGCFLTPNLKRQLKQAPILLGPDQGILVISGTTAALNIIIAAIKAGSYTGVGLATTASFVFAGITGTPSLTPGNPLSPIQGATLITPLTCTACTTATCVGTTTTTSTFGTTTSTCACVPCTSIFPTAVTGALTYLFAATGCSSQTTLSAFNSCIQQLYIGGICNNLAINNNALLGTGVVYTLPASLNLPFGTTNIITGGNIHCHHHGSKKGLLGLLGLLGLIPLLLCCLCLLLLCMRRKRAAPDVHFATFDPHPAGPIGPGGSLVAPSIAPGFGAPTALPVF